MLKKLDTTHQIFRPTTKAYQVAAEMQANDEDWTYQVIENPNPGGPDTAIIKIYDEDGEFVANV